MRFLCTEIDNLKELRLPLEQVIAMLDEPNQRGVFLDLFFLIHLQKLVTIVLALEVLGESIAHLPLDVYQDVAHN